MESEAPSVNTRHLIGGTWEEGKGDAPFAVYDPATGQPIAQFRDASLDQGDAAVAAARAAFPAWSALSINRRAELLLKVRMLIDENVDELARLLSLDNGKTLNEAYGEVTRASEAIAGAAGAPIAYHSPSGNIAPGLDARRVRIPLGVCVAITPFNFPVMNPSMFAAWVIVCGNTLVLKPSEQTPLVTNYLIELFRRAGVPDGVINIVHGGVALGERLVSHPDVKAVTCITSTPVARAIYVNGASHGKRVQANGGGKNPYIVLADADIDRAVDGIADGAFGMAGQRCLAASRCIVVDAVYDEFVDKLVAKAKTYVVGSGRDSNATMGPLVSAASKARVESAIERAIASGATILLDGRKHDVRGGEETAGGYFVGPTIVTDLNHKDPVDCQETFGPFLVVHRVASFEAAIEIANDTEFGNAAAIYTSNGSSARAFENAVNAGNIGINTFPAPPMNFQMGGLGASFFGDIHALGDGYFQFFTDHKVVVSRW
jgi:malonate-semialdehyde dehydrogenase (acetylating) / methylmalonate-semialdehyde dehydrogenase